MKGNEARDIMSRGSKLMDTENVPSLGQVKLSSHQTSDNQIHTSNFTIQVNKNSMQKQVQMHMSHL